MVTNVTNAYCGFIVHLILFAYYDVVDESRAVFCDSGGFGKAWQEVVV